MFFRRLAEQLARQNWTAILIEFLIVVAGVFVGTQVSNWNAARIERQRGDEYLHRIAANLADDQAGMDQALAYWADVIRYGEEAIAYADHGRLAGGTRWRTALAFYQASQLLPFDFDATTYRELVSAGDLRLIRSGALRSALAGYYVTGPAPSSPHLLRYNPEYRTLVRSYTPVEVSDYIWRQCIRNAGLMDESLDPDCAPPVSEDGAQVILERYLAAPGLVPALRFWIINQKVASQLVQGVRGDSVALSRLVHTELAR